MFDAHTHLNSDQLYTNRTQHVYDFIERWWTYLVSVWIDSIYNTRNIEVTTQRLSDSRHEECTIKSSIGIHPCSVGGELYKNKQAVNEQVNLLVSQFQEHTQHLVAVGECGIDAHWWDYQSVKKLQRYTFEQQCILAQKLNLPIIIHSRSQRPDTIEILKQFSDLKIYLHCRWYTPTQIEQANKELPNLRIGFCGNTTYPKAQELKESLITARSIQNQWWCKVVIETDAPYLAPQAYRWKQNTPKYLYDSGTDFAEILGVDSQVLFDTTKSNACSLYKLL